MAGDVANISFKDEFWKSIPDVHLFRHIAMATIFEIYIQHPDSVYAEQVADEAFSECDRLEQDLSHFIENSDISRISTLVPGDVMVIGLGAFECLQHCRQLYEQTNHAFDVTIGALMNCWRNEDKTPRTPTEEELAEALAHTGMNLLQLDEERHTVQVLASPLSIDLGGYGKGYAVDRMAALLREWEIDKALIHAGYSSVLALDAPQGMPGWPLSISHPDDREHMLGRIQLHNRALSGSGLEKGQHIIDPRTGQPVTGKRAAWTSVADAATADALSTALMVMTTAEIEAFCSDHAEVSALIIFDGENEREAIRRFGKWQDAEFSE